MCQSHRCIRFNSVERPFVPTNTEFSRFFRFRLEHLKFSVTIVDDATLCSEAAILPILKHVISLVLVGDVQLTPKISANVAGNAIRSMFTRVHEAYAHDDVHQLLTQCRMHSEIQRWPNTYFYQRSMRSRHGTCLFPLMPYTVFSVESTAINGGEFVTSFLREIFHLAPPQTYSYGVITPKPQEENNLRDNFRLIHWLSFS